MLKTNIHTWICISHRSEEKHIDVIVGRNAHNHFCQYLVVIMMRVRYFVFITGTVQLC